LIVNGILYNRVFLLNRCDGDSAFKIPNTQK